MKRKRTYLVEVYRTSYSSRTLEIEATSEKEAKEIAYDTAGNFEFDEDNAEYEVESVTLEKATNP